MRTLYRHLVSNRTLLLRMLNWPLLWRVAYNAAQTLDHEETPHCIKCAANLRKHKFTHTPIMNTARQMACGRCGLPLMDWKNHRRCPGKPPARPSTEKKPDFVVFPLNW